MPPSDTKNGGTTGSGSGGTTTSVPASNPSSTTGGDTNNLNAVRTSDDGGGDDGIQSRSSNNNGNVSTQAIAMKLLDLRLKPSTAIISAISGEFTASGQHEICMLKAGGTIEIHRIIIITSKTPSSLTDDNKDDKDDNNDEIINTTTSLKLVCRIETRSILRSVTSIRLVEEKRDMISIGSDSGYCSILDFYQCKCKIVLCVNYGKSGCRRTVPGQYITSDPKGRAILISAIEKRKLVYVINRDHTSTTTPTNTTSSSSTTNVTIASPLEANRSRTITYGIVGLDNGYDNPIFATIECQYPDYDGTSTEQQSQSNNNDNDTNNYNIIKQLAYYELDLGLNHVSRKWAISIRLTSCCLIAIPGGSIDGPGGVLIGSEDYIEYYHYAGNNNSQEPIHITCVIPRRQLHPIDKGILITSFIVHKQKKKSFFILGQSELGDVYKITLLTTPDTNIVTGITISLLDTLPICNSMCVSKLGMLFIASEFGNHDLYQFLNIDLNDSPTNTSEETMTTTTNKNLYNTKYAHEIAKTFTPTSLQNLRKIVTIDNPSPTISIMVGELAGNEVSPQIYTLTGRGPHSTLSILRHGASVTELAVTELPGIPGGIFTIANNNPDILAKKQYIDQYIVVSFADATLVLSIGETVEEVGKESGLLTNAPTLACSALGTDGAICQVHPSGVRQIHNGQAKQWHCPGLKRIECASVNETQVIIALAGGEVIYFDFDSISGNLTESAKREMGADVCSLDVGMIPNGKSRSLFAAVACRDQTVRIVSLEPGKILQQRSSTALRSRPHSVSLQSSSSFIDPSSSDGGGGIGGGRTDELTLVIGLDDGSSLRATIDSVTGSIGTTPTRRFLGARPVSVSRIILESQMATLLLSSRPWISRKDTSSGKHIVSPLSFAPLDHGCCFRSDTVKEGIVATAGKTLRILSVDIAGMGGSDADEAFNTNKVELRYTPRQMALIPAPMPDNQRKLCLVTVESDYNEYGLEDKNAMGFDPTGERKKEQQKDKNSSKKTKGADDDDAMDMDEGSDDEDAAKREDNDNANEEENAEDDDDEEDEDEKEAKKTPIRGPVPTGPGRWGSCIRLLDPSNNCASLDCIELGRNEAALCCASVRFHSKGGEPLLAVGTVSNMTLQPSMKQSASHIILYRILNGERLQLLHRTTVDDGPILALAHYQGRLLVGIGNTLRLYEMGKRQLLRKCELRRIPTCVKTIQTVGDRAFIGDLLQSIQIVKYDSLSNQLMLIACDPSPRPIVCQELLDINTIAVGDKFGNISILRLPRGADIHTNNSNMNNSTDGQRALWDSSREDSTPKLELLCQYCIGEVVTGMTRSSLVAGGSESLIYVTVTGRLGALVPFTSRIDVDFYTQLENTLRTEVPRPTGRDPYQYRSYYAPIIHVVDGDLCDSYNSLHHDQQMKIAKGLDLTVSEVVKKLEDTRNGLL